MPFALLFIFRFKFGIDDIIIAFSSCLAFRRRRLTARAMGLTRPLSRAALFLRCLFIERFAEFLGSGIQILDRLFNGAGVFAFGRLFEVVDRAFDITSGLSGCFVTMLLERLFRGIYKLGPPWFFRSTTSRLSLSSLA